MSRDLATDLLAAIQSGAWRPRLFYHGQFRNTATLAVEDLRFWTGYASVSWDGHTWSGVANLLSVDGIEETTESRSVGFKVRLSGLSSSVLSTALTADQSKYLPGKIWLGAQAENGSIVADPYLSRAGKLNRVSIDDSGETCNIVAEYEDENVALLVPFNRRYTPEDQALDYAGDRGFDMVAELQNKVIEF